jgi:hypothetical protein
MFLVAATASAHAGETEATSPAPTSATRVAAPAGNAALVAPVKLPPGTRWLAGEGRYAVGGGLAEATRAIEKQLARAGIASERLGPYRVRGVEVVRLLSQQPSTAWLAIHLVRKEGRTFLDIVERPPAPPARPAPAHE